MASGTDPISGAPVPEAGDTVHVQADIKAAALGVASGAGIGRFADSGARDAAIPSPATNQMAIVAGVLEQYNGTSWVNRMNAAYVAATASGSWSFAGGVGRPAVVFRIQDGWAFVNGIAFKSTINTTWEAMGGNALLAPYGVSGSNALYLRALAGNGSYPETPVAVDMQVRADGAIWVKAASSSQTLLYLAHSWRVA